MFLPSIFEVVGLVKGASGWLTPGYQHLSLRVTLGSESLQGQPCPCLWIRGQLEKQKMLIDLFNSC